MGNYWEPMQVKPNPRSTSKRTRTKTLVGLAPAHKPSALIFENDQENCNIELIVVSNENEHEEALLKSILQNQRKAFGRQDILVANTLSQLGELMSHNKQWPQSEVYFREAFEILKEKAKDNPQLSEIRIKLVNALTKQGNWKTAIAEFQDIKEHLEDIEIPDEVSGLLDKIKLEIHQFDLDSNSKEQ